MPAGCLACGFSRGAATVAALALRRGDALRGSAAGGTGAVTEDRQGPAPMWRGSPPTVAVHAHREVMSRPFRSFAAAAAAGASALRDHQQEKEAPRDAATTTRIPSFFPRRGLRPLGSPVPFWPS